MELWGETKKKNFKIKNRQALSPKNGRPLETRKKKKKMYQPHSLEDSTGSGPEPCKNQKKMTSSLAGGIAEARTHS